MEIQAGAGALLAANLNLTVSPDIVIAKTSGSEQLVPKAPDGSSGFLFDLNLALPYDGLSRVLGPLLKGKTFTVAEGFMRQQVILEGCKLYPALNGRLVAEVPFSGSYSGTIFIAGLPVFDSQSRHIALQQVEYDLKTTSLLLKGAKWLFGNLVLEEIKKHALLDLAPFYEIATARLTELLNKSWGSGIQPSGSVDALQITQATAQKQQLLLQLRCSGQLKVVLPETLLPF